MRHVRIGLLLCCGLAACAPASTTGSGNSSSAGNGKFLSQVPEEVIARAAPNQNLNAVTILEEDGCFWYEHVGPVETTLLPLLSKKGGHLCTVRETEAA